MNATCDQIRDLLQRRLDGDVLERSQSDAILAHLAECDDCRWFDRDMARMLSAVELLPVQRASPAFASQVMAALPARQGKLDPWPGWATRLGRVWAPLAAVAGLLILIYHAVVVHGVSLFTLGSAVSEWANQIDLSNLSSLMDATSSFAWSLDALFLLGISLMVVAIFAIMAQAIARPPVLTAATRRRLY